MKKKIILIGVFAAVFLMVSSATAVPQAQSETIKNQCKLGNRIDIKLSELKEKTLIFLEKNENNNIEAKWDPHDSLLYMLLHLLACFLKDIDERLESIDWHPGKLIGEAILYTLSIIIDLFLAPIFLVAWIVGRIVERIEGVILLFQEFFEFIRDEIINDPELTS